MNIKQKQNSMLWAMVFSLSALMFGSFLFESSVAYSQEDRPKRKTKKVESIPAALVKDFEKVNEAMTAENYAEAESLLKKIENKGTARGGQLNNITRAYLYNFRGNIAFTRDDLNGALRQFEKILDIKEGVSESFYNQIVYVIAQVYFSQEKYGQALKYAQRWFKLQQNPPADAYMLIGQAQYMLKRYDAALPNVQKGIQKYVDLGSVPKEGWLNLLSGIYREKKDFKKMLPVLKQLVQHYPKKTYLLTIGGVYNELNDQPSMTAIYQAIYDQGLLNKESELVTLASLQMSQDNPYQAARIMEKGLKGKKIEDNLKNNRIYSQALYASKEYEAAISPLKKAAKLSKDGKLYDQLAQSYIALNQWDKAEKAFVNALKKGGLSNRGQTYVRQGMSRFEQKKFKAAKISFQQAAKFEKSAAVAKQWSAYVDKEVNRLAELKKEIVIKRNVLEKIDS